MIRILHVDDDHDIREVAAISLALDPNVETRNCASGEEAIAVAGKWQPDVILLDVMMPDMDGPATLLRLRESPATKAIPVIFMTARAQARELDLFRALGAVGVISKPFDPVTLAASVRSYMEPADDPMAAAQAGFRQRLEKDTAALIVLRAAFIHGGATTETLAAIRHIAHGLSGAGGLFGFIEISEVASVLEDAIVAEQGSPSHPETISHSLNDLIFLGEDVENPRAFALTETAVNRAVN